MKQPREGVALSRHTTLGVGGEARWWWDAAGEDEVLEALAWADERALEVAVIGGGSNLLVADRGFDGLVLRVRTAGIEERGSSIRVGAGLRWDELCEWTVARGLAGLECLSGIPGDVGAAPMQNVGAYGQEVADTIEAVHLVERRSGRRLRYEAAACGFDYRDSAFKREPDRFVIVAVDFALRAGGSPMVAYAELERALDGREPTLKLVRDTVIALRRDKSMVFDPADENHRSAGSFFVNPVLPQGEADRVEQIAARVAPGERMPRYPAGARTKLSAAWLIERAGLKKGTRRGRVGISTRHSLAIVNLGGAIAADIVAFAAEVRARVRDTFGVTLSPEPRTLGFRPDELAGLAERGVAVAGSW